MNAGCPCPDQAASYLSSALEWFGVMAIPKKERR